MYACVSCVMVRRASGSRPLTPAGLRPSWILSRWLVTFLTGTSSRYKDDPLIELRLKGKDGGIGGGGKCMSGGP